MRKEAEVKQAMDQVEEALKATENLNPIVLLWLRRGLRFSLGEIDDSELVKEDYTREEISYFGNLRRG